MLDFGYYNMDCMAGMKLFPDKYFDVAIVDPPYGINAPNMAMGTNKSRTKNGYPAESTASRLKRSGQAKEWDSKPPTEEYFKELFRVSKNQIIWGGNYFNLPPTKCFVVWDKVQPWDAFSQAEIAWTSYNLPSKTVQILKHWRSKFRETHPLNPETNSIVRISRRCF